MALKRIVELTLNNNRTPGQVLVKSLADFTALTPVWIEDDKSTVRIRFADPAANVGAAATPVALDLDNVIVLGGKKARGTGAALFSATDFVKVVVPADEEAGTPADVYYEGRLNLNTGPMGTAFGTDQTITVWVDVEVQAPDPDGGDDPDRTTFQFQVIINRQSYDGDAAVADADPVYPAPALIALRMPASSNYRIIPDGAGGALLQILSTTSGKFHTLLVAGAEGEEALTIGPPEV
jgi:hypothetical protein